MKRSIQTLLLATAGIASVAALAQSANDRTTSLSQPGPIGIPHETALRGAGSSSIDLRSLPLDRPRVPQFLNLRAPRSSPIELPDGTALSAAAAPAQAAAAPAPLANFAGLDFATWGDGYPPNANGDVGPAYVIEAVDSSLGIYDKTSGARIAAFTFDAFMSQGSFGNLCDSDNRGNPVVLYDTFEDRWVISDVAYQTDGSGLVHPPGSYQCIAVSKTGDPVAGGWNFYSINIADGFGADPKLGIWPDGIYLSVNLYDYSLAFFQFPRLFALNKAQMYAGAPTAQAVSFDAPAAEFTVLPANARLQAGTPPAGSPNYFAVVWQFRNALSVYQFHVDWNRISTSTLSGPFLSQSASSWGQLVNGVAKAPGTDLQTQHPRLMVQNQYANFGGVESIWASHTVGAASPTSVQAAIRFYQVGVSGGVVGAAPTQAATFSPDATVHRFMPSLAVDRVGNMAIGYSASSQSLNPAIRYAGRLAGDSAGTITQSETSLIEGGGSQSVSCDGSPCTRWGGYSSMSLDPDGCTFWMVNEFYAATGGDWQTRIGAFKFPSCSAVSTGSISGIVTASAGGAPIVGAIVQLGSRTTTTDAVGAYSFNAIAPGTYPSISAGAEGYAGATAANIVVGGGSATPQDFALAAAPAGACLADVSQADLQTGVPAQVDLSASPGDAVLAKVVGVDQHADENGLNSGYAFNSTSFLGQTFTAGTSGKLTRADASIFCAINCTGANPNMILEVRTTSGGLPVMTAGGLLATATIGGSASGTAVPFAFAFSPAPTLTAGVQYGLVLRLASNRTVGNQAWRATNGSVYAGGVRVSCSASACALPTGTNADSDFVFKTVMQTGNYASGDLVSALKDSNPAHDRVATWTTLSWNGSAPAGTVLRFQVGAGNSPLASFTYVGPDGTAGTYYAASGGSLSQFNGSRYLRYRAYLTTSDSTLTPTLADATVCYADVPGPPADLSITNSDGADDAIPGGPVTYTITAANAGPNDAAGSTVIDTFPAALSCSWTCSGSNGGTCSASGSGDIFDAVDLPDGASVTYTATCGVAATASGSLANTASVTGPSGISDPNGADNSATDSDSLTAQADLAIDNTDGVTQAIPGGSVSYTLTASNAGPSAAPGSKVTDAFPAALTCAWTCAGSGSATCTASGSGGIDDTVDLPPGGSVVYVATCTIAASATGSLINTANVATAAAVTDPAPANDSKTDTDTLEVHADIAVTMTDQRSFVRVGDVVDYVIEVTNPNGPSDAVASVSDVLPAELTAGAWTCVGSGGASCADGSGATLSDTAILPVGGKAAYLYSAQLQSAGAADLIANTASASLQAGIDATPANNSATDNDTVVLFRDDFEGTAPLAAAFAASDAVSLRMNIDATLLAGLGSVPVGIASGRSADGLRFDVQAARFGHAIAVRVTTRGDDGASTRSPWQTVDARRPLLEFAWQPASANGNDGYLAVAAGAAPLLVDGRFARHRPASLLIAVDGGVPWLWPVAP